MKVEILSVDGASLSRVRNCIETRDNWFLADKKINNEKRKKKKKVDHNKRAEDLTWPLFHSAHSLIQHLYPRSLNKMIRSLEFTIKHSKMNECLWLLAEFAIIQKNYIVT